jgi:hypothetical protein
MKIEELSLSALKYFIDAVELGSITQSAERNSVSRPAVSQAIVRLEEWYGKTFLVHEKRSFALTDAGKSFYRLAKQNFENLSRGFSKFHDIDRSLRIGCSGSLVDFVFPKIQSFVDRSAAPVIKIGSTPLLLSLLADEKINIAFLIENQPDSRFKTKDLKFGRFELRSKDGKLGKIIITTEKRLEVESFFRFMAKSRVDFLQHIEVESWTVANRMAELMEATCLVPDYLAKGKLNEVKTKWSSTYKAQAVFLKNNVLTPLEASLIHNF